jgi:hypothetical protein
MVTRRVRFAGDEDDAAFRWLQRKLSFGPGGRAGQAALIGSDANVVHQRIPARSYNFRFLRDVPIGVEPEARVARFGRALQQIMLECADVGLRDVRVVLELDRSVKEP